ncbi:hypothetical protein FLONG3_7437 [Fusarium longipes]|uniref:Uncharacterized protein n=1 Tax=Fusarium longipes TaxID=694270 RepID=A0A395SD76_9HYPO|nr:hypothetical protein FLONG3_7437 [Fusarium longipes]
MSAWEPDDLRSYKESLMTMMEKEMLEKSNHLGRIVANFGFLKLQTLYEEQRQQNEWKAKREEKGKQRNTEQQRQELLEIIGCQELTLSGHIFKDDNLIAF